MKCEDLPQCLTCKHCKLNRGDALTYNEDNSHNFYLYLECTNENVVEFVDDYGVPTRSFIYDTESQDVWVDASMSVENCKHSYPDRSYEMLNVKSKLPNFVPIEHEVEVETAPVPPQYKTTNDDVVEDDIPHSEPPCGDYGHAKLDMGRVCKYTISNFDHKKVDLYKQKNWVVSPDLDMWDEQYLLGRPQTLADIDTSELHGRKVVSWSPCYGTYGMGGPGFMGIDLDNGYSIVYCVWAPDQYTMLNERVVGCHPSYANEYNPYTENEATELLTGCVIDRITLTDDACCILLTKEDALYSLTFFKNHPNLPPFGCGDVRKNAFKDGVISNYIMLMHKSATLWV